LTIVSIAAPLAGCAEEGYIKGWWWDYRPF